MEAGRDKSNKNKIEANDPEMLAGLAEAYYRIKKFSEGLEIFFEMSHEFPVVRQIQEAVQGVYSMERSEEHTSELQSHHDLVCRLLLEKKKKNITNTITSNETPPMITLLNAS